MIGKSGTSWAFGYDAGQQSVAQIKRDWEGYVDDVTFIAMKGCAALRGGAALLHLPKVKNVIHVPRPIAEEQFQEVLIPRYVRKTQNVFPGATLLAEPARGALVSLVYNRGGV